MRSLIARVALGGALALAVSGLAVQVSADSLVADGDISRTVIVRDVRVRDGVVSGLIVNQSTKPLRDVKLLIRHTWLWATERTPGSDSPGRSAYYVFHDEIAPEVSAAFRYKPEPPLPNRSDGRFETSVDVVGFSEVDRGSP